MTPEEIQALITATENRITEQLKNFSDNIINNLPKKESIKNEEKHELKY